MMRQVQPWQAVPAGISTDDLTLSEHHDPKERNHKHKVVATSRRLSASAVQSFLRVLCVLCGSESEVTRAPAGARWPPPDRRNRARPGPYRPDSTDTARRSRK